MREIEGVLYQAPQYISVICSLYDPRCVIRRRPISPRIKRKFNQRAERSVVGCLLKKFKGNLRIEVIP